MLPFQGAGGDGRGVPLWRRLPAAVGLVFGGQIADPGSAFVFGIMVKDEEWLKDGSLLLH